MARSWLLSLSCPERLRDRFRDRIRLVQPCIPLRDGPKNAHHVNILVILLVKVLQGGLPGQCQQGGPVYVCICYSRGEVCRAGSQRRGTDPRPTGQPSVDSGHERCSLLVTDGDDFDSLRSAKRIGKREGLFARNLEDEFNLLILKTLYEQVGPFQRTTQLCFVRQCMAYLEQ